MKLELPIKTVSEANTRDHWAARRRRQMRQREEFSAEWLGRFGRKSIAVPCIVRFTRIGPRLLDDDNLRSAFKALRDEAALLAGVDDADPRIRFEYGQELAGARRYAVRIEVESREGVTKG